MATCSGPRAQMLDGIDTLVFDIQDVGARFYTYITTLGYCLEAAGKKGIEFYVLDRPNPINGVDVDGPVLDPDLRSFIGYFPMPIRHGMTVGELAEMFNRENHLNASLHVIKMQGWQRTDWFDETGQAWINPSPESAQPDGGNALPRRLPAGRRERQRGPRHRHAVRNGGRSVDRRQSAGRVSERQEDSGRALSAHGFQAALRHFRR